MENFLPEFCVSIAREAGASFIFGTAAAALKGGVRNDSNILTKQVQALRRGAEQAQFAIIYNTVLYLLSKLRVRSRVATTLGFLVSAYIAGRRNGAAFGIRSGVLGLAASLASGLCT